MCVQEGIGHKDLEGLVWTLMNVKPEIHASTSAGTPWEVTSVLVPLVIILCPTAKPAKTLMSASSRTLAVEQARCAST